MTDTEIWTGERKYIWYKYLAAIYTNFLKWEQVVGK